MTKWWSEVRYTKKVTFYGCFTGTGTGVYTTATATGISRLEQQVYRGYRYGRATGVYIRAMAADVRVM